jgi:biopolymer transport protein ExbD
MKIRHSSTGKLPEKVELQMTPMIDVVFQLMVFFIFTLKIVTQEGDFNIRMPIAAPREGIPDLDQLPPIKVRMRAGSDGKLVGMALNERAVPDFATLRNHIIGLVGTDAGPVRDAAEVELDCDYNLHYSYVIDAITAVSGYLTDDRKVVKLVEKIKFTPPKRGAGS